MGRVLLADDHPLFRHALRAIIARLQPETKICEAESLAGAKAILEKDSDIVLILLDLKMSDCGDFAGLVSLRTDYPAIPIVVVSSSADAHTITRAMAFGAVGFIPKSTDRSDIARALKSIMAGEIWTPPAAAAVPHATKISSTLTPTQLHILTGLQRGLRNKEIAFEIGVSEKTVKAYMSAMFRKLGVNTRTQALIAVQTLQEES